MATAPFPIPSIQVDGGSEFMAGFEDACERLDIPLRVLPPRRPQWNGCVERTNRSAGLEFRNRRRGSLAVAAVAAALGDYEFFHNYQRPHIRRWRIEPRTVILPHGRPPDRPVPYVLSG